MHGIEEFVVEKVKEACSAGEKGMNRAELQRVLGYLNIGLAIAHESGVSIGHFGCGDFIELAQTVNGMLLRSIAPTAAGGGGNDSRSNDAATSAPLAV